MDLRINLGIVTNQRYQLEIVQRLPYQK